MKTRRIAIALVLGLGTVPAVAHANFTMEAVLTGAAEVPVVTTPGLGLATVTFDSAANELRYSITFSNLLGPANAGHIHAGGPADRGPVILPFTRPGPPAATLGSFSGTLTAADLIPDVGTGINTFADAVRAIESGNAYVNIHSTTFPEGEIRGQLRPVPEPTGLLLMGLGAAGLLAFGRTRRRRATA